jgi:hypothetical protein
VFGRHRGWLAKAALDVVLDDLLKFVGDALAAQRQAFLTVDKDGR